MVVDHQFKTCECGCGNCQHFADGEEFCCLKSHAEHAYVRDEDWQEHLAEVESDEAQARGEAAAHLHGAWA